ncbi:MAG TPA: hypothetical protein VFN74_00405, partial [Chloroflexota bacterium]|nr:hypothetical protein [Chloroflexota bacterium]
NMATADRFSETAKQGQGPASEAMHSAESAGGSLHGMQGQLDSSMKRAEEEKPGQMGNVDKGQMMGGPGQSKDSAGQAGDVMTDGVSEAEQAKAESQESKDHNAEARGLADDADEKVADKQGENEQDVQHLLEEKEACLARLAEIESQESELTQLHDEAVGEAHGWAEEHASKRERLMASAGSE